MIVVANIVTDLIFEALQTQVKNWLLDTMKFCFDCMIGVGGSFWSNPVFQSLFKLILSVSNFVLVASMIVALIDIGEEAGAGNRVPWTVVAGNFIKGIAFANLIVLICASIFRVSATVVRLLPIGNLSSWDWSSAGSFAASSINAKVDMSVIGFIPYILLVLFLIVGCFAYEVMSFLLFTNMVTHTIAGILYVPDIVRGDTSAIGSWLRLGITFNLTYIIQSLFFFIGISYLIDFDLTSMDMMLGVACLIGMFSVPKVLSKYGFSMGVTGIAQSFGNIASAGSSLVRR